MSNSIKIGRNPKLKRSWAKTKQPYPSHGENKRTTGYLSDHFIRAGDNVDKALRQAHLDSTKLVEILPDPTRDVCFFVDDDRPCPDGWQLARSLWDFRKLLEQDKEILDRVSHISLDWNMGMGNPDGMALVDCLAMEFNIHEDDTEPFLPNLKEIYFHSSDRDMAMKMRYHFVQIMDEVDPSFKDCVRLRLRRW